ncbi:Fc.00g115300.m01.CDS01 [Cosmosporella sp. VM-42]
MNPVNTKPYQLPPDAAWLITGCSSGIGREIATLVSKNAGQRLIATARDPTSLSYLPDDNPNTLKLALDVTDVTSVNEAFAAAAEHFGQDYYLDVVVNNAGYSLSGDTEGATEEEVHREMETLFFGTVRVTTRAIGVMRQSEDHRGGIIFNISSLAGQCAFPGHAFYHSGKFAVEGFSESVAREVHPDWNSNSLIRRLFNLIVNFCIVEPSGVKTSFEGHSKAMIQPHPAYAAADMPARKLEGYVRMGMKSGVGRTEPEQIAKSIFHIASRGERVPLRLPLGPVAWKMIKAKLEGLLGELDEVKSLSFFGKEP